MLFFNLLTNLKTLYTSFVSTLKLNLILVLRNTSQLNLKYDSGHTPFHIVAQNGHLEVCELLFKKMEEKNPQNSNGETPLQIASENNQWKNVH